MVWNSLTVTGSNGGLNATFATPLLKKIYSTMTFIISAIHVEVNVAWYNTTRLMIKVRHPYIDVKHLLTWIEHCWPSTEPNFSQLAALDSPTHLEASGMIQDFFMGFTRPAA